MNNILSLIVEKVKQRTQARKKELPLNILKTKLPEAPPVKDFSVSLKSKKSINLICEVKKASPSKGIILHNYEPVKIAKIYAETGAKAISVLTEENFFLGSLNDLKNVKNAVKIPVLRKDFITEPYHVYESRYYGADCILLIARILENNKLADLIKLAKELNLASLVEIHDKADLEKALSCKAENIGINNRDLNTLQININTSLSLFALIPEGKIVISESGIQGKEEIKILKNSGINNFLIGESLLTSSNIQSKVKEFIK